MENTVDAALRKMMDEGGRYEINRRSYCGKRDKKYEGLKDDSVFERKGIDDDFGNGDHRRERSRVRSILLGRGV